MRKRIVDGDDSYKGDFTGNCPLHAGIGSNLSTPDIWMEEKVTELIQLLKYKLPE